MSSHSRPFARGLLLASLLALVAAGSASAATPQQQLPTGTELGSRWHSDSSHTIDPAEKTEVNRTVIASAPGNMNVRRFTPWVVPVVNCDRPVPSTNRNSRR